MKRRSPSRADQGLIRRDTSLLHLPAGAKVFSSHRPSKSVYFLSAGRVELASPAGAIFDLLGPGEFFGEKTFLPRAADQVATVVSPATVAVFRKSQLVKDLQQDRRFTLRLLRKLAFRLDRYEQAITAFVTERAERRLARILLRLAPSRPASGWVRLPYRLTNQSLARMVGTTRWRISGFLNRFQRLGWLSRRKELWIEREGLKEYLTSATGDRGAA